VQEFRNVSQGGFDLCIAGTRSSNGYAADGGGEFVVDPMVQLVEQHALLLQYLLIGQFRHNVLLIDALP
jgi:hypothetical protein